MKILHAIQSVNPKGGGPIEGVRQLCTAARGDLRHEIVSIDPPDAPFVGEFPVPVHALGPGGLLGYSPHLVPWLRRHARDYRIVVVHGHWRYVSVGSWRALRATGVPYFAFPHGMLDPWFNQRYPLKHFKKLLFWPWTEYLVLRDARAVIFTCEEEKRRSGQSFKPYRANGEVVTLGVSRPPPDEAEQRSAFYHCFPELRGKRLLLFLSRIHPKKGCDLLIQAFSELATRHPDIHLVLAGPDQLDWGEQLKRLAESSGIADRITWTGMLSGDVKWGAYRAAEAFILPTHHENFGIVVAEALACGLPVLISDKVQIWQEISASRAGFVDTDTVEGTRRLIQRWLEMPPRVWQEMRLQAHLCFDSKFEIDRYVRRFQELVDLYVPGTTASCTHKV